MLIEEIVAKATEAKWNNNEINVVNNLFCTIC